MYHIPLRVVFLHAGEKVIGELAGEPFLEPSFVSSAELLLHINGWLKHETLSKDAFKQ